VLDDVPARGEAEPRITRDPCGSLDKQAEREHQEREREQRIGGGAVHDPREPRERRAATRRVDVSVHNAPIGTPPATIEFAAPRPPPGAVYAC
jgi:hypothetical protein